MRVALRLDIILEAMYWLLILWFAISYDREPNSIQQLKHDKNYAKEVIDNNAYQGTIVCNVYLYMNIKNMAHII